MKPRVLFVDIETSPNVGYTWAKWEQNVIEFTKEWELLSVAYKWADEKKVHCIARPQFKDPTDKSLTKAVWTVFEEADVIVAHNGDQFDNKKVRAKFVEHGLKPPSLYRTIDTKKIAKQNFNFNSNSLNDIAKLLGLGKKMETGGFELWLGCMRGDKESWKKMIKYNKQDVVLLEKVYLKFRSWMTGPVNLAAFDEKPGCPSCGSGKTQARGFLMTAKGRQQRHQCQECARWFTGKAEKKNVRKD